MSRSRRDFLAGGAGLAALTGCGPQGLYTDPTQALNDGHERAHSFADTGVAYADTAVSTPSTCRATVDFAEGPYYLPAAPARADLRASGATGVVLHLTLIVRSSGTCERLADAEVEIWHVQQDGDYDMSSADGNYRATVRTGFDGAVEFTTHEPIAYDVGDKMMPKHFHFRINAPGHDELVTQLRFTGDPWDDGQCPASLMLTPTAVGDGSFEVTYEFALRPS
jgi:protocatechuate 3,4-dioxygenase beta subunit